MDIDDLDFLKVGLSENRAKVKGIQDVSKNNFLEVDSIDKAIVHIADVQALP